MSLFRWHQIAVLKSLGPPRALPHRDWDRLPKHRSANHARVKLPTLAARIDRRRQLVNEPRVVPPPRKRRVQLPRVHTRQVRLVARVAELGRDRALVAAPQREEWQVVGPHALAFAKTPHVLEKQIAVRDVLNGPKPLAGPSNRARPRLVVDVVARVRRQDRLEHW